MFLTVSCTQQWDLDDYVIAKDILIAGQSIRFVILDNLQPMSMCRDIFAHVKTCFLGYFCFMYQQ